MLGGTDPTLAGRVPPVISAFQLRPSPTGAALIPNIRKYSDNQVPYISIFQDFILPITFQPIRVNPSKSTLPTPQNLESIISISCQVTNCAVEAPQPFDSFTNVEPGSKPGTIKLSLPKFEPNRLLYHSAPLFNEPFVLGQASAGGAGFVSISKVPGLVTIAAPIAGTPQTYTIKGYFTERNFFDREWVTEFGFLKYRVNANGVYWNSSLLNTLLGMLGINKLPWILRTKWTPDQFFQPTAEAAKKYDSPQVTPFIKGASKIYQYKPSEIGSIRFYFTFTVITDMPPPLNVEIFTATMSVKYNTEYGTERLKFARKRTDDDAEPKEEEGAATEEEAKETEQAETNKTEEQKAADQQAADDDFDEAMKENPFNPDKYLTLY